MLLLSYCIGSGVDYVKLLKSYSLFCLCYLFIIFSSHLIANQFSFSSDPEHLETWWCCITQYVDQSVTFKACAGLNGMKLGGQVLTVVQAVPDGSSMVFY